LARVNSSPLWIGQTKSGSLVYGSTQETILNAAIMLDSDIDWEYSAGEGEYFKVKDGKIVDYLQFTPYQRPTLSNWRNYAKAYKESDKDWETYAEYPSYYDTHAF
jgi:hypothetical protein